MKVMKELLQQLSDLRGTSGFEYRLTQQVAALFKPFADEVSIDALGSVTAVRRCGKPNAKKVMIEAHCDEIGLMVSEIDPRGFLKFVNIGGVDQRILPSSEVIVHGKVDVPGIIGAKPPHLQEGGEGDKSTKMKDMAVDTGMDYEQVSALVSVGDSISFAQSVGSLAGGQFSGKTLDDRAGVAAVLTVLRQLQKCDLEVDLYAVAAVQEEVGCRGAKTAAYTISPDLAVAIDVCHAITPDNSENAFLVGSGTVISVGPNIHPRLAQRLFDTAKQHRIPYSVDVDGGNTGTDAWTIQIAQNGVATALLSIPLKYMHTPVETVSIADVQATADLLTCFVQHLEKDLEGWLCY